MKKYYKYLTGSIIFLGAILFFTGLLSSSVSADSRLFCIFLGIFTISLSIITAAKFRNSPTTEPEVLSSPSDLVITTNEELQAFWAKHTLVDTIRTKVVGVTFSNKDGTSRQDILAQCSGGDEIALRYFTYRDSPAYAVMSQHGQIGNLSAELARIIDSNYDGAIVKSTISAVTGGCGGYPYGCNLIIEIYLENSRIQEQLTNQQINNTIRVKKPKQSTVDSSFIALAQWYAARGGEDLVDDE